jgi:hypothetical protein
MFGTVSAANADGLPIAAVLTKGEAHDLTAYGALMDERESDLGSAPDDKTESSFLRFVLLDCIRLWVRFAHKV